MRRLWFALAGAAVALGALACAVHQAARSASATAPASAAAEDVEEDDSEDGAHVVRPPGGPVAFRPEGDFSDEALRRGVHATEGQCRGVANAVWVPTKGSEGECLKYWIGGYDGKPIRRAEIFLHGDCVKAVGKVNQEYVALTNETLQRQADNWAKRLGVPYIFIGRPGTHGSSGDHMQRRRPIESQLVSAAIDQIKARYGIADLAITGLSGGGHLTAALITLRSDILCAVPASAPSSPSLRWKLRGFRGEPTGYSDSYEPVDHIDRTLAHRADLRVFVVGDPHDANVPWASQTILADRLRANGFVAEVLEGQGDGPEHHVLGKSARNVGSWCLKTMPNSAIQALAAKGLKG